MVFTSKHRNLDDVYSVIHSVNANKATGYDMMPPQLVKISAHYLCYPLFTIINLCIDKGVFPDSMKHAEIVPVFTKDEKMEKSNYRPVSILSCLSKVWESCQSLVIIFFDPICQGSGKHMGAKMYC